MEPGVRNELVISPRAGRPEGGNKISTPLQYFLYQDAIRLSFPLVISYHLGHSNASGELTRNPWGSLAIGRLPVIDKRPTQTLPGVLTVYSPISPFHSPRFRTRNLHTQSASVAFTISYLEHSALLPRVCIPTLISSSRTDTTGSCEEIALRADDGRTNCKGT